MWFFAMKRLVLAYVYGILITLFTTSLSYAQLNNLNSIKSSLDLLLGADSKQQLLNSGQYSNLEALIKDDEPKNVSRTYNALSNGNRQGEDSLLSMSKDTTKQRLQDNIFGTNLFRVSGADRSKSLFISNINVATPKTYVLGTKDEIIVSVAGLQNFSANSLVSPEGIVFIKGVGPVMVGGLSIEAAKNSIRKKMISAGYFSLSSGQSTLSISIGNIRTIQVFIAGAVMRPGTYYLPSLGTAFNALFEARGPSDDGSFRHIRLMRNNKLVKEIDLYDFLIGGNRSGDINLQDMDVIFVPFAQKHIKIEGEVKRPFLYELDSTEMLADLLNFSGGFNADAYTEQVKVFRQSSTGIRYFDVPASSFSTFNLLPYDEVMVEKKTIKYSNFVELLGHIYRPGKYAIEDKKTTIKELLGKSGGLRPDAEIKHALLVRTPEGEPSQVLKLDLDAILQGTTHDMVLWNHDQLVIPKKVEIQIGATITVQGEVKTPMVIPFIANLGVDEVITLAGGFTEPTSSYRIEVSSRTLTGDPTHKKTNGDLGKVVIIDNTNKEEYKDFKIEPYSVVTVYNNPVLYNFQSVHVEGEVIYPGSYSIKSKNEKVYDVILRAGGLTDFAHVEGAYIKRHQYGSNLTESVSPVIGPINAKDDKLNVLPTKSKSKQQITASALKIPLQLSEIMRNPKSNENIALSDSDILVIPKMDLTVKVSGEAHNPTLLPYKRGKGFRYYFRAAGGVNSNAKRNKAYIIYPNGKGSSGASFFLFTSFPKVRPGSEIIIPSRDTYPHKVGETTAITAAVSSAITSLALLYTTFIKK